ncbi:MAG: hypothetical protein WC516_01620 [Patescibacteria group bacterium]
MAGRIGGDFRAPQPDKMEISSKKGIQFKEQAGRKFLDIPMAIVRPLIAGRKMGRDAINVLHAEVFDGAYIM